jgi:protein TonB
VDKRGVSEGSQGSVIIKAEPTYPPGAEKFNASGPVEVRVTVSETGRVKNAVAISGHLLLRAAAVQAARRWVFTPTTVDGVPVQTQIVLTFDFTIHK